MDGRQNASKPCKSAVFWNILDNKLGLYLASSKAKINHICSEKQAKVKNQKSANAISTSCPSIHIPVCKSHKQHICLFGQIPVDYTAVICMLAGNSEHKTR
jgi:hypothetical protein